MSQTHWKKLRNPDYLGAYELEQGKDVIVTIKSVNHELVKGSDGKEQDCIVARFVEAVKPLIVNATNAKTIQKLYKTPYVEEWSGKKIQLFIKKEKIFGDFDDVLRIRPFPPKTDGPIICTDCKNEIADTDKATAKQIAEFTQRKFGCPLCADCSHKRADKKQTDDTSPEKDDPVPQEAQTESEVENNG